MVILDPIAGTGLHSVLLRQMGVKVFCADSVDGGSTQTSGADTNYLNQCMSTGSAARAAAAAGAAAANAAVSAAGHAVAWTEMENLDVFDSGEAATEWWQRAEAGCPILMLSFPPPPPAEVAEAALRRFRGSWLLFIGEWRGCTGGSGFFDLLEAEWQKVRVFSLPQWPMMEDRVYLLRRQDPLAGGKKT
ncbi:Zdhhc20, partial [Symbiodinium natans]